MIKLSLQICLLDPGGHHRQGICLYHAMYRLNPNISTKRDSARQLIGHYIMYPFSHQVLRITCNTDIFVAVI